VRVPPGPTGEAAQRLEAIRATTNAKDRMRATIDLANSLPPADFAIWFDRGWFSLREGMELTLFTQILTERWRQEDPEAFLRWFLKNQPDADDPLIFDWAATQPQRLLNFFKSHPDDKAELYALKEIASENPELVLRRFQEMVAAGIFGEGSLAAWSVLDELAKQSPAALETIIDTLPSSLKPQAQTCLLRQKLRVSFATELRKLWERPDRLSVFGNVLEGSEDLEERLLGELANLPVSWRAGIASERSTFVGWKNAAKWAAADLEGAGFTAEQAQEIRNRGMSKLECREPETALKLMTELDLPPDQKEEILRSVFGNLKDEPEKAEQLLTHLGSEEEGQIARIALQARLFSPNFRTDSFETPKPDIKPIDQPDEWLASGWQR
jgi:hypothetical protein